MSVGANSNAMRINTAIVGLRADEEGIEIGHDFAFAEEKMMLSTNRTVNKQAIAFLAGDWHNNKQVNWHNRSWCGHICKYFKH